MVCGLGSTTPTHCGTTAIHSFCTPCHTSSVVHGGVAVGVDGAARIPGGRGQGGQPAEDRGDEGGMAADGDEVDGGGLLDGAGSRVRVPRRAGERHTLAPDWALPEGRQAVVPAGAPGADGVR